jgi:hypothetical protein
VIGCPRIRFSQPFCTRSTGGLLPPLAVAGGGGMTLMADPFRCCSIRVPPA